MVVLSRILAIHRPAVAVVGRCGGRIGARILWGLVILSGVSLRAQSDEPSLLAAMTTVNISSEADDPSRGNRVLNLENGYEALALRVHLIRQARRSIELQTFIWTNDEVGRLMIYELVEAARRGVKVRVIADHMVSDQNPEVGAFLATANPNLEVRHYRPVMERLKPSLWQQATSAMFGFHGINQRMHNKLMVVDGAVMLTGGRNIENTYFNHSPGMNFRDREVMAVGPVVRLAEASFEEYWAFRHVVPSAELKDVATVMQSGRFPRYETRSDYDFGGYFEEIDQAADDADQMRTLFWHQLRPVDRVEFLADDPGKGLGLFDKASRTTKALRQRVGEAQREVTVQSPYLILSGSARKLARVLRRQNPAISLRVSTNSYASTDNILAYSANYRLRSQYVEKLGLEVFEFKPHPDSLPELFPEFDAMAQRAETQGKKAAPFFCLHAKSLVVDDRVSFVGSYNMDPRSVSLNTEVGLIIEDEAFARELRAQIERDMEPGNSWVIARREYPLGLDTVNGLISGLLALGPVDPWPIQNTSSFELKPGTDPVPTNHPEFYQRYRDTGIFPGASGAVTSKEILTRIYKAVGASLTPIM
ncbi:phospholipase D-like domain-containing protein [Synoicihabitans lomoniglobus]|uniref:Phospholipase D family protein n=1 Tax=Synoicihabitans lomoniglobus TaxID=2909285 RepID=A0AAE9ZVY1_9BACT|nr:phospholipase D family protein [Opitutaceae bacterium LMO-M01]WED63473.1 phospholipase D family protein [Opitutaceae bacterium LMO-M01]